MRVSYEASSLLMFMGSLFIWGNRPLNGLLNCSVAGLGNHVSMGVDLTIQ